MWERNVNFTVRQMLWLFKQIGANSLTGLIKRFNYRLNRSSTPNIFVIIIILIWTDHQQEAETQIDLFVRLVWLPC